MFKMRKISLSLFLDNLLQQLLETLSNYLLASLSNEQLYLH